MSSSTSDMTFSPARATALLTNLKTVLSKIESLHAPQPVRLVLVSKLKPASDIAALHQHVAEQSIPEAFKPYHFGENYVQELSDKAAALPRSVKWHFIGGLQSNKAKGLAEIPNLWCVSSVDSAKKADLLEKGRAGLSGDVEVLHVKVQVNTSGEESKSGVEPGEALELCRHIRDKCPHLKLSGLMTIGAIARSHATTAETENEDFMSLLGIRDQVAEGLGITKEELELSMGMSSDFEGAIRHGSNEVRIGSNIFGERPPKPSKNEATGP